MKRRDFLLQASSLLALTSSRSLRLAHALELNGTFPDTPADAVGLNDQQWTVIAAVQEHLLPHEEESPGAGDVNAQTYLKWAITSPGTDSHAAELLRDGLNALEGLSHTLTQREFPALDSIQAEDVLRQFEQDDLGRRWLRMMLEYVLEALLTDPVYGGNTDEAGWKWLDHRPGYKRPPEDRRYPDLLKL